MEPTQPQNVPSHTDQAQPSGIASGSINAPKLDDSGTLELDKKSISTVAQAWQVCKTTEANNRQRSARTADLQEIHDGRPPKSGADQVAKGKAWQSNFSTGWLAGVVGRVAQRFISAIVSQATVTQSRLPEQLENSKKDSDLMQAKFTKLIRGWPGYTGFINSVSVETVLQGYAYATFLDPYTWKPTFIKQDRCYVPEGSGQHARDLQLIVVKMDYRLDEFLDLFAWDTKSAEDIGYDIAECEWAANAATVQDQLEDATTTQFRRLADMINEGVQGLTYTSSGVRVVNCFLLFNREYDGSVSYWMIHRQTGRKLRFSFKLFPRMEGTCALFAFEPGNGCIHSSKGLGRMLGGLAVAKERFRNGIVDNSLMAGMMILQADSKDKSRSAPQILSPFIMVDKTVAIPQQQFPSPSEGYAKVDLATDQWAEQRTGAFIATNGIYDKDAGPEKTATQAAIEARQGAEAADIQIRRFLDNIANLTQIQQLRAFSDDNIKEARRMFDKLVKNPQALTAEMFENHDDFDGDLMRTLVEIMVGGVTDERIKMWRRSPCSIYAHMQDQAVQAGVASVAQLYTGNPYVDQQAVLKRNIEGMVGPELASQFVVPGIDQTVQIEAQRQQLIESSTMYDTGIAVPVSPRDNHLVHGAALQDLLEKAGKPVLQNFGNATPQEQKAVELNLNHLGSHLEAATQLGQNKQPAFKELEDFYKGFRKDLEAVAQMTQEAQTNQQIAMQKIRSEGPDLPGSSPVAPEGSPSDASLGIPAATGLEAQAFNAAA